MTAILYNTVVRDYSNDTFERSVVGRLLLFDLKQVPASWKIRFRGGPLERTANLKELMCCPEEPIQIYKQSTLNFVIFVNLERDTRSTANTIPVHFISSDETIEDVKYKLNLISGIPTREHHLIFKGTKLEEGRTLKDYGISNGSRVHMTPADELFISLAHQKSLQFAKPGKRPWRGLNIGLNLVGVCPIKTCAANAIEMASPCVILHVKYGVMKTSSTNKFPSPACSHKKSIFRKVGRFHPRNFGVSSARSLFRFKKTGYDQPVKGVLIENIETDEWYKAFDASKENAGYDLLEITTVKKHESPYFCVLCDSPCASNFDWSAYCRWSEVVLGCGPAYHKYCAPGGSQECVVCRARLFENLAALVRAEQDEKKSYVNLV